MDKYKTKLESEKKLLEEELSSIGVFDSEEGEWVAKPEDEMMSQEVQDEADMADRAEDYEERSSILSTLNERLSNINKALSKIEDNTYGVCEVCGGKIEEERLEVNPSAKTCEKCMNKE